MITSDDLPYRLLMCERELERLRGELAQIVRVVEAGQSGYICCSIAEVALMTSATEYPYPIDIKMGGRDDEDR